MPTYGSDMVAPGRGRHWQDYVSDDVSDNLSLVQPPPKLVSTVLGGVEVMASGRCLPALLHSGTVSHTVIEKHIKVKVSNWMQIRRGLSVTFNVKLQRFGRASWYLGCVLILVAAAVVPRSPLSLHHRPVVHVSLLPTSH